MKTSDPMLCDSCDRILSSNYKQKLCFNCYRNTRINVSPFDIKEELDLEDLQDVLNPSGKTPARISEE